MNLDKCYQLLGIYRGASLDELKAAYRSLARKFHPDLNPGDLDASHRFIAINEAYQVLLGKIQAHSVRTAPRNPTVAATNTRTTRRDAPPAAKTHPATKNEDELKWQLGTYK